MGKRGRKREGGVWKKGRKKSERKERGKGKGRREKGRGRREKGRGEGRKGEEIGEWRGRKGGREGGGKIVSTTDRFGVIGFYLPIG